MKKSSRHSAKRKPSLLSRLAPGASTFLLFFLIGSIVYIDKFQWFSETKTEAIAFIEPFITIEVYALVALIAIIGAGLQFPRQTGKNKTGIVIFLLAPAYVFLAGISATAEVEVLSSMGFGALFASSVMMWFGLLYGYFEKHYYSHEEVAELYHKVVTTNIAFGMPGLPPSCEIRKVKQNWKCYVAVVSTIKLPIKYRYRVSINIPKGYTQHCFWLLMLLKSEFKVFFTPTLERVEKYYQRTEVKKLESYPEYRDVPVPLAVAA